MTRRAAGIGVDLSSSLLGGTLFHSLSVYFLFADAAVGLPKVDALPSRGVIEGRRVGERTLCPPLCSAVLSHLSVWLSSPI